MNKIEPDEDVCPKCGGEGLSKAIPPHGNLLTPREGCSTCHGTGKVPDSRLLTDAELCPNIAETEALRKQDAKTASVKDAECQQRVERIKREIEDYMNDLDKRSDLFLQYPTHRIWWQKFWQREGVK